MQRFSLKQYCVVVVALIQFFCVASFANAGYINFGNYIGNYTGNLVYDPYLTATSLVNYYRSNFTYLDFGYPDQASYDVFLNNVYHSYTDLYYDGTSGNLCWRGYMLPSYECTYDSANSVPAFVNDGTIMTYYSPIYIRNSIHDAWTDKATYQPGEPVYVTGLGTRNDLFMVSTNGAVSTDPGCVGSNGCGGTVLYTTAPLTSGTYSIPVTGCWFTGWWCTTSYGLTFDVVAQPPTVNINFQ